MEKAIQTDHLSLSSVGMPPQRLSYREKNKDWYIQNEIYLESLLLNSRMVLDMTPKVLNNKNLFYNGIINRAEIASIMNPHGKQGAEMPDDFIHYPRGVPRIKTLVGEELKRRFDWSVFVTNRDAITQKEQGKQDAINQFIIEQMQQANATEEELNKQIEEFQNKLENWQDGREKGASELLKYLWTYLSLKNKFNDGFEDNQVTGKEVYRTDKLNGKPIFEKCNPEAVNFLRNPNSFYIDDSDASCEIDYIPCALACDLYHEYLRPEDIDYIMKKEGGYMGLTMFGVEGMWQKGYNQETNKPVVMPIQDGDELFSINANQTGIFKGFFDRRGNIRRVHVRWKGLRKIGKLTYFDEYGKTQQKYVSEEYKINKLLGESVEWVWITEVYETTRIGEKVFLKMQPRETQYRELDNISACKLGYAGMERGSCTYDLIKKYELQADIIEYKLYEAISKYLGRIANLDLASVPDGMDAEKWFYYAQKFGFAVSNSFDESKKAQQMGITRGQSGKQGDMQIGDPQYIAQMIQNLEYIEGQMDSICGIGIQRRGEKSTGGLGTDQLQLQASSNITEQEFYRHEEVKLRALRMLLETAKTCVKDGSEWVQYVTNDDYIQSVQLDAEQIQEADYNVQVGFSINDQRMIEMIQTETAKAVQTGMVSIAELMDIVSNDSTSAIRRKLEKAERNKQEQQQAATQAEQKHQMAIEQERTAQIHAQLELQKYKIDQDNLTKLQVAEIGALGFAQAPVEDISAQTDQAIKQQELVHKQFQANLDHTLKLKAEDNKATMKDKELSFKEKELAAKQKIEKEKLDVELKDQKNFRDVALINARSRNKSSK